MKLCLDWSARSQKLKTTDGSVIAHNLTQKGASLLAAIETRESAMTDPQYEINKVDNRPKVINMSKYFAIARTTLGPAFNSRVVSVIVRVLGNDLPPLHSTNQTVLNTQNILEHEVIPSSFKRLWIVNCIFEQFKVNDLISLFTLYNQTYRVITSNTSNPAQFEIDGLNVNRARNVGLKVAFEHMRADWAFLFDGGAFMTSEGLAPLEEFAIGNTKEPAFHFTAVYRLLFKLKLESNTLLKDILNFTTGQQEVMMGLNKKAYETETVVGVQRRNFFNEKLTYGKADKFTTVARLRTRRKTHCREILIGVDQKKKSTREELYVAERCGYMLRLPYYPDEKEPYDQREYFRLKGIHRVQGIQRWHDKMAILKNQTLLGNAQNAKLNKRNSSRNY